MMTVLNADDFWWSEMVYMVYVWCMFTYVVVEKVTHKTVSSDDKATQIQKVVPICSLLGDGDLLNIVSLPFSQLDIREE